MERTLFLKISPFSVNRMYYGDGRTKTSDAREWSYKVFHQLSWTKNQESLSDLRNYFDPKSHVYRLHFSVSYPKSVFYTKSGILSGKTLDITNWEKPLQDLLFSPSFFDLESPYGCKNLNENDKYVASVYSEKKPADVDQPEISIVIKIEDKP